MPYIKLPEGLPGIVGPMACRPEIAKPLNELAEILLRGPSTLTPGERALIATYVFSQNDCLFCQTIHGAVAAYHLGGNEQLVLDVKPCTEGAAISDKLKALMAIAGQMERQPQAGYISRPHQTGVTERSIRRDERRPSDQIVDDMVVTHGADRVRTRAAPDLHRDQLVILVELHLGRCGEFWMVNRVEHQLVHIHARESREDAHERCAHCYQYPPPDSCLCAPVPNRTPDCHER
jgi:hypothetical protein